MTIPFTPDPEIDVLLDKFVEDLPEEPIDYGKKSNGGDNEKFERKYALLNRVERILKSDVINEVLDMHEGPVQELLISLYTTDQDVFAGNLISFLRTLEQQEQAFFEKRVDTKPGPWRAPASMVAHYHERQAHESEEAQTPTLPIERTEVTPIYSNGHDVHEDIEETESVTEPVSVFVLEDTVTEGEVISAQPTQPERTFSHKVADTIRPYVSAVQEKLGNVQNQRRLQGTNGQRFLSQPHIRKLFGLGKTMQWARDQKIIEAVMINGQPNYSLEQVALLTYLRDLREKGQVRQFSSPESYLAAITTILHE